MNGARSLVRAVLPPPLRRRLGAVRDRRRSIQGHRELYGAAVPIDLAPLARLREAPMALLSDRARLEELLPALGLNDELVGVYPAALEGATGRGLRFWQYPCQFAPYLLELSRQDVGSYVEIGTRHGGTFALTVEYLRRFGPVAWAAGVDIQKAPGMGAYTEGDDTLEALVLDSRTARFARLVAERRPDLVLVDGDHSEEGVRADLEVVREHARLIAFHDIVSELVPGVGAVWREFRAAAGPEWRFEEYVEQYPEVVERLGHAVLGIGLAIRER